MQNPESEEKRQRRIKETTADVQGNYPNFKQKLAEKGNFVISKVNESRLPFGKRRLRAATF